MADGIASAAAQLENMSITSGDSTKVNAPLANLPLPRELRDKVWAYILLSQHVHEATYYSRPRDERGKHSESNKRDDSIAHTYRFHTNVLAVNREIRKEALPMLNANHFVLVTHRWPKASILKHGIGLPIVTENQTHATKFRGPILLKVQFLPPSTQEGYAEQAWESFLIVADDLPALVKAFQWMIYSANTQAKIVARYNGGPEYHSTVKQDLYAFGADESGTRSTLTVRFPPQNGEFIDPAIQEALFRPLNAICSGGTEIK